jgi:hypothetical protein
VRGVSSRDHTVVLVGLGYEDSGKLALDDKEELYAKRAMAWTSSA